MDLVPLPSIIKIYSDLCNVSGCFLKPCANTRTHYGGENVKDLSPMFVRLLVTFFFFEGVQKLC